MVDYISRDPQQKALKISTYDEQFIVSNLDAIKLSAKRFLLNAENYTDFAAQNPLIKLDAKNSNSSVKLCSEFDSQNREYSKITNNDNTISELTPKNSHSSTINWTTHIPQSLFVFNPPTNHLQKHSSKFKRNDISFQTVQTMS